MTCKERPENLLEFVRGLTQGAESASISKHIAACERCSEEAKEWKKLIPALDRHGKADLPDSYWASFLPRVHERLDRRQGVSYITRLSPFLVPAAVSLLLLSVIQSDMLQRPHEAQEIHSLVHQLTDSAMLEVSGNVDAIDTYAQDAADDESVMSAENEDIFSLLQDDGAATYDSELDQETSDYPLSPTDDIEVVSRLESNQRN